MRVIRLSLSALLILSAPSAVAQIPPGYVAVARSANVPPDMLYALACAESGRSMPGGHILPWPWSLNVAGVGQVFPSRAAAYAALLKDPARKGSRFAVILSGGNIDREMYLEALNEGQAG